MHSGMTQLTDPAITKGMNTVEDPANLKDGEAVKLLNAFPGNPPAIIKGSTSVILNGSNGYRFVPDGISMAFSGTNYIFVWAKIVYEAGIQHPSGYYVLLMFDKDTEGDQYSEPNHYDGWKKIIEEMYIGEGVVFNFIRLFSSLYCFSNNYSTSPFVPKVIETPSIIRDMFITVPGQVSVIYDNSVLLFDSTDVNNSTGLKSGKYYTYAFQFVRRNDSAAFESGTVAGMIMPDGLLGYKPKRIDTFLPGMCIGQEDVDYRKSILTENLEQYDAWASSDAQVDTFADNVFTLPVVTQLTIADTSLLYTVTRTNTERPDDSSKPHIYKVGLFMTKAGSTANYTVQYSITDAPGVYYTAATDFKPILNGINVATLAISPLHTSIAVYKLLLTNTLGAGEAQCSSILFYVAWKHAKVVMETTAQAAAILQGATHLRVSRSLGFDTQVLAEGETKFFLFDLPLLNISGQYYIDYTSDAAFDGELNQLLTGYSNAPSGAYIEYIKGRLFVLSDEGRAYYSEAPGIDGATDLELAETYPMAWSSLFKPLYYYVDCDYNDGQKSMGMKLLANDLFFFKERKIFALYDGDPTATSITKISDTIGCVFPHTLTKCETKGLFGKCLLFLSEDGPMAILEGGQLRSFSEFKIKELWGDSIPAGSTELFGLLKTDHDWIIQNCSAKYFKNAWWVTYTMRTLAAGKYTFTNKVFGYYVDPTEDSVRGAFQFEMAANIDTTATPPPAPPSGLIIFRETDGFICFKETTGEILFTA